MGKLVISVNISLDGVVQDPTGDEGFSLGGWFDPVVAPDREAWAKAEFDEALGAGALLMGRRSYEWFVARGWASRTGEWADRLRSLPKYVVSSTLADPVWDNSTVVRGDVVSEVETLKKELDGDIVVYASTRLVHTLLAHNLIDELRLMTLPVVVGGGERLFGQTGEQKLLRLVDTRPVGNDLLLITYRTA